MWKTKIFSILPLLFQAAVRHTYFILWTLWWMQCAIFDFRHPKQYFWSGSPSREQPIFSRKTTFPARNGSSEYPAAEVRRKQLSEALTLTKSDSRSSKEPKKLFAGLRNWGKNNPDNTPDYS